MSGLIMIMWAAIFHAILTTYNLNPNIGGKIEYKYFDE